MIEFKNCLVAHIDVMGFKELLDGSKESNDKLQRYFRTSKEYLTGKTSIYSSSAPEDNFKSLFVSDSIILSVEISADAPDRYLIAGRFFFTIGLLQYILAIKEQIWTRGAISVGPLAMNVEENILVGKSFVNAYQLESVANYPRVIIDPRVLSFFKETVSNFSSRITDAFEQCHLIEVQSPLRWGGTKFVNDAVMIDWFRNIYTRTENFAAFFRDLELRMNANHDLFTKSNRLIPYLLESQYRQTGDNKEKTIDLTRASRIEANILSLS